jgi:DNA ligase 1
MKKPMLAIDLGNNLNNISYPKYASFKLDGIRVWFHPELGIIGRSLKPIRSKYIINKFKPLLDLATKENIIIDGEFYCHSMTFQEIISAVMTIDYNIENDIKVCIFEIIDLNKGIPHFKDRYEKMLQLFKINDLFCIVKQVLVHNKEEVLSYYKNALELSYEGLILRDPLSPYKHGRSTIKEEYMLKVKSFETFDAKIIDVTERFINTNESFCNECGYRVRRNTKDDKAGTGLAACFVVEYNGEKCSPVICGSEGFRATIWKNKESYIGKMIEYKGMLVGAKDVPRHPVFIRFREDKN